MPIRPLMPTTRQVRRLCSSRPSGGRQICLPPENRLLVAAAQNSTRSGVGFDDDIRLEDSVRTAKPRWVRNRVAQIVREPSERTAGTHVRNRADIAATENIVAAHATETISGTALTLREEQQRVPCLSRRSTASGAMRCHGGGSQTALPPRRTEVSGSAVCARRVGRVVACGGAIRSGLRIDHAGEGPPSRAPGNRGTRRVVHPNRPLPVGTARQARALAVVEVTLLTGITRHRRLCTIACLGVAFTDRTLVRRSTYDGVGLTAIR